MTYLDDFQQYLRQKEPDKKRKGIVWATAIGLQAVDGLYTSTYLHETARRNIEGEISIDKAQELIKAYYVNKDNRNLSSDETEEADKVSANIAKVLVEDAFVFSVTGLTSIHKRIFNGVFKHAGKFRDYNITKKEWVLNGESVLYAPYSEIRNSLEYDLSLEKRFSYDNLDLDHIIDHLIHFISGIWQIHPFREGNTRATAIFLIQYLRSMGFKIDNSPFVENSWYFRNALVRANYQNPGKGIVKTDEFLRKFLSNLLKETDFELRNRYTHIHYSKTNDTLLSDQATKRPSDQATKRPSDQILAVVRAIGFSEKARDEIMKILGIKHIPTFRKNYLSPALEAGFIERTIPDTPTHSKQRYRLTEKGRSGL